MSWIAGSTVETPLSSSSEFPLKINPTVGSPFILDLLYPLLFVLCLWYWVAVHLYTPDPLHRRRGKQNYKSCAGYVGVRFGSGFSNGSSLAPYVPCSTRACFTYTMLTWMCLPPTSLGQNGSTSWITKRKHLTWWWSLTWRGWECKSWELLSLGSWWAKLISIPSKNHSLLLIVKTAMSCLLSARHTGV